MLGLWSQFVCAYMAGSLHQPVRCLCQSHAMAMYTHATVQSDTDPTLSQPTRLLYNAHTVESLKRSVSRRIVWLG